MALEQRLTVFNFSSSLTSGCTALDTSLNCQGFQNLPVISGGSQYVPLVLANDSLGKEEIVYLTAHTSGAVTGTVVRGMEGSTAQVFSPGDVVRCSPTTYDGQTIATSTTLPTSPFYGQDVYETDLATVVTYTPHGWSGDAPIQNDPNRKHRWFQGSADVGTASTMVQAVGISSAQNGTSGTIATQTGGALTLNKQGVWSIGCQMFQFSTSSRNQGVQLAWTGGAFPGQTTLYQVNGAIGGSGAAGNSLCSMNWTGYVTSAQAVIPILFSVWSSIVTTGGASNYNLFAEYLGG